MLKTTLILIFSFLYSLQVSAAEGLITTKSRFKVPHTADRFKGIAQKNGLTIFKHIFHSNNAQSAGKTIRPMELIIFGNPKIGTELMKCSPTIGIDLPQKLLVWQDETEQTWIGYNNPIYIADRHNLNKECRTHLNKIANALATFTKKASGIE